MLCLIATLLFYNFVMSYIFPPLEKTQYLVAS